MEKSNNSQFFQIFDDLIVFILGERENAELNSKFQETKNDKTKEIIAKTFQNIYDHYMTVIAFHDFLKPLLPKMNPPKKQMPLSKVNVQQIQTQINKYSTGIKNLYFSQIYKQQVSQKMIRDIKAGINKHLKSKYPSKITNNYQKINEQNKIKVDENYHQVSQNIEQLKSLAEDSKLETYIQLTSDITQIVKQQSSLIYPNLAQEKLLIKLESYSKECVKTSDQIAYQTKEFEKLLVSNDQIAAKSLGIATKIKQHTDDMNELREKSERQMKESLANKTALGKIMSQGLKVIIAEIAQVPCPYMLANNRQLKVYSQDRYILQKSGKYLMTFELKDDGVSHMILLRTEKGEIITGGDHKILFKFSSSLIPIKSVMIGEYIYSGIVVGNMIYCGCEESLCIFDDELQFVKKIPTKTPIYKMLTIDDDYLLLGQSDGHVDIMKISKLKAETSSATFSTQLSVQDDIFDIIKTQNQGEYALATNKGLYFGIVNNNYTFTENQAEHYFEGEHVECIVMAQTYLIFACVYGMNSVQVVDRKLKKHSEIANCSVAGSYNSLQKIIDYDDKKLPYLILKDIHNITIINTLTLQATHIIQCQYDNFRNQNSMVQHKEGKQTKLLTLYYDKEKKVRQIKEFIINEE